MSQTRSLKKISVANQKGGVGKTTTSVNFAASLAAAGHKTLLIDLDPQGNASSGLGLERYSAKTIYDVLIGRIGLVEAIQGSSLEKLFVIPANQNLIGAEVELINAISRERKLKTALKSLPDDFEFVVFDCPPSLGLLTINAFTASDSLLIPIQCEYYAMEGLGQLLNTYQIVKDDLNEDLTIEGIVLTMYDPRTKLTHEVVKEMKAHFKNELYETAVPRNIKLSEAPSFGKPVILYDHLSKGALAYMHLVDEFLIRNGIENPDWKKILSELFPPPPPEVLAEMEDEASPVELRGDMAAEITDDIAEETPLVAAEEVESQELSSESSEETWKSPYAIQIIDTSDASRPQNLN
jgi:chromosome partitioning protein